MPPKPQEKKEKAPEKKKKQPTAADKGVEYIRAKELDNLETILKENPKVINKHEIKTGKNMLHVAVEEGLLQFVDLIVDYKANLNFRTSERKTAVMLAAHEKEDDILAYLIKRGADVTLPGYRNDTALHIAAHRGHLSVADAIIKEIERVVAEQKRIEEFEASLLKDDDPEEEQPEAAAADDALAQGAPAAEAEGGPPAPAEGGASLEGGVAIAVDAAAVVEEEEEVVEEEVAGVKMNRKVTFIDEIETKNEQAETPLGTAIKMQSWHIADLLISKGADINTIGMNGNTPLTRSAYDGKLDSIKYCLKQRKCDLHARNIAGETALIIAVKQKYFSIAEYLIKEHGASIEDKDELGNNALLFGAMMNHMPTIKFAIEVGKADVDATNNWGTTAAMYAAKNKLGKKALDYLVSLKCDLNMQDKRFATALMYACRLDDIWRASMLLEKGADPDLKDEDGKTAVNYIPDHNVINVRGNLELHDENVRQFLNAIETYNDKIVAEDGVPKDRIRGTELFKFEDKCEVNYKGRGIWLPAKIARVRMGANAGTFDVEFDAIESVAIQQSKYPPRFRPEWIDRQVENEKVEARNIAWDKWIAQNVKETKDIADAEKRQMADEARQMRLDEEERIRKKAEWDALPEEEKERVMRKKAKDAAREKAERREAAIARGEDPDALEAAALKKEKSRQTAENRAAKSKKASAKK